MNYNFRDLFDHLGGNAATVERLDTFFNKLNGPDNAANAFMGNEPCEAAPWAYDFAGAPYKTQQVIRRIQHELFFDRPGGLPGNDDAGSLSSWYVFSSLGLFPAVPGVGGLVIGSPMFDTAKVTSESGTVLTIIGHNAGTDRPFVQSLQVNGNPSTSLWLPAGTILSGKPTTLTFELGTTPNTAWGTAPADAPPSFDAPVASPTIIVPATTPVKP